MSAAKDWEDPATWTDWIARLAEELVSRDLQYVGIRRIERMRQDPDEIGNADLMESDPGANATLTAAATLNALVAALSEIPTFESGWGLATIRDVAASLADVDAGARPKLFNPRPDQVAPKVKIGRRATVATILLCAELLIASGSSEKDACGYVANAFAEVGHRGRKGDKLSPKSIIDWRTKSGDDVKMRVLIDQGHQQWRSERGWPPCRSDVEELVRSKALDPYLLTQI